MKYILLNSTMSYVPPFNWTLFLIFEIITIFIETFALWFFGSSWLREIDEDTNNIKSFSLKDAFLLSFLINFFSALIAIPIWIYLGVGI